MVEMNKKANQIINQVARTGEPILIVKHGEPIAEIRPIDNETAKVQALSYLRGLTPIKVKQSLVSVIDHGRRRGF